MKEKLVWALIRLWDPLDDLIHDHVRSLGNTWLGDHVFEGDLRNGNGGAHFLDDHDAFGVALPITEFHSVLNG